MHSYVSEGASKNLFEVRDGILFTLLGITRDAIIKLAAAVRLEVQEQVLFHESLYLADEVFMSGTATEIIPVRNVDGIRVDIGKCGPGTKQLMQAFWAIYRQD